MSVCGHCGTTGTRDNRIEVHHRDRDRSHNDSHNLIALCRSCHCREHGKDFVPGEPKAILSCALHLPHVNWIARRAALLGISKSQYIRNLLDRDMKQHDDIADVEKESAA